MVCAGVKHSVFTLGHADFVQSSLVHGFPQFPDTQLNLNLFLSNDTHTYLTSDLNKNPEMWQHLYIDSHEKVFRWLTRNQAYVFQLIMMQTST